MPFVIWTTGGHKWATEEEKSIKRCSLLFNTRSTFFRCCRSLKPIEEKKKMLCVFVPARRLSDRIIRDEMCVTKRGFDQQQNIKHGSKKTSQHQRRSFGGFKIEINKRLQKIWAAIRRRSKERSLCTRKMFANRIDRRLLSKPVLAHESGRFT